MHALDLFQSELEDRFGGMPTEAQDLLSLARIRMLARAARVARIDAGPSAIALTPRRDFTGKPEAAGLEEKEGRFLLREAIEDPHARLERVAALLEELSDE
jgi:transcription-repair coupling factor (superfamily II helicase)